MLPTTPDIKRFLTGLGTTKPQVVASLELLGARDDPDIYLSWETARAAIEGRFPEGTDKAGASINANMPIGRHCVMAVALRLRFPELRDYDNDNWGVGADSVRLKDTGDAGLSRWVDLPAPVRGVIRVVDEERRRLANGEAFTPTYPNLLARKVPS